MNNEEIRNEEIGVQDISNRTENKNNNLNNEEVKSNEALTSSSTENNKIEDNSIDKKEKVQEVEEPKRKKKKKEKWKTWDIVSTILISIFTVFVVYQLVLKFTGHTPNLFGYRTDVVLTDSMSVKNEKHEEFLEGYDNQLQPFDLVVSKLIDDKTELKVYDIVIFDSPIFGDTIHRIVDIDDDNGTIKYQIRGDKAETPDGWFVREKIIAKYEFSIPKIGVVFSYLQSFYGLITIIGIMFIVTMYTYFRDLPPKEKLPKPAKVVRRYVVVIKKPKDPNVKFDRIIKRKNSLIKYIKKKKQ